VAQPGAPPQRGFCVGCSGLSLAHTRYYAHLVHAQKPVNPLKGIKRRRMPQRAVAQRRPGLLQGATEGRPGQRQMLAAKDRGYKASRASLFRAHLRHGIASIRSTSSPTAAALFTEVLIRGILRTSLETEF
jgi:hypothetical protein